MKHTIYAIVAFLLATQVPVSAAELTDDLTQRINYTIGHQIGSDFKRQQVELNESALTAGLDHGVRRKAPDIDRDTMQQLLVELKKDISSSMKQEAVARIERRRQEEQQRRQMGRDFQNDNGKREGVVSLPSGVQYRIINQGDGLSPAETDTVVFNYRATTVQGKEYDSSYKRGGPASYRANSVLPGFTEVIQLMKPGARWQVVLPPESAYGRQGPLAHQTVVLDVELLEVRP